MKGHPPIFFNIQFSNSGVIANKFQGAEKRGAGINIALKKIAKENAVHFLDSNTVIEANKQDGIHLDAEQYFILGNAVAKAVSVIL